MRDTTSQQFTTRRQRHLKTLTIENKEREKKKEKNVVAWSSEVNILAGREKWTSFCSAVRFLEWGFFPYGFHWLPKQMTALFFVQGELCFKGNSSILRRTAEQNCCTGRYFSSEYLRKIRVLAQTVGGLTWRISVVRGQPRSRPWVGQARGRSHLQERQRMETTWS